MTTVAPGTGRCEDGTFEMGKKQNRAQQRAARALSASEGIKYTEALRRVEEQYRWDQAWTRCNVTNAGGLVPRLIAVSRSEDTMNLEFELPLGVSRAMIEGVLGPLSVITRFEHFEVRDGTDGPGTVRLVVSENAPSSTRKPRYADASDVVPAWLLGYTDDGQPLRSYEDAVWTAGPMRPDWPTIYVEHVRIPIEPLAGTIRVFTDGRDFTAQEREQIADVLTNTRVGAAAAKAIRDAMAESVRICMCTDSEEYDDDAHEEAMECIDVESLDVEFLCGFGRDPSDHVTEEDFARWLCGLDIEGATSGILDAAVELTWDPDVAFDFFTEFLFSTYKVDGGCDGYWWPEEVDSNPNDPDAEMASLRERNPGWLMLLADLGIREGWQPVRNDEHLSSCSTKADTEYGIFTDAGLVRGGFHSRDDASEAIETSYDSDDEMYVAKVCQTCHDDIEGDCIDCDSAGIED